MPETRPKRRARARNAALDEAFYAELLHIAGLRETVANGKPAVARLPAHERLRGSLIENALARMEACDAAPSAATPTPDDEAQRFSTALRLCIAWICRLVFLKRLEARLLALHDNDPAYAFLRANRIRSFAELDALCREVLGGDDAGGAGAAPAPVRFARIPRFDGGPGALFASHDQETATLPLGTLADDLPLPLLAARHVCAVCNMPFSW